MTVKYVISQSHGENIVAVNFNNLNAMNDHKDSLTIVLLLLEKCYTAIVQVR